MKQFQSGIVRIVADKIAARARLRPSASAARIDTVQTEMFPLASSGMKMKRRRWPIAVDAVILYPVQTAANLLAFESGYFQTSDVRRLGFGMLVLTIAVALLVLPYWELLDLPLSQLKH